jgi:type IV pilus assembly protein PilC
MATKKKKKGDEVVFDFTTKDAKVQKTPFWKMPKKSKPMEISEALRGLSLYLSEGFRETQALTASAEDYKKTSIGLALTNASALMEGEGVDIRTALFAQDSIPMPVRQLIKNSADPVSLIENIEEAAEMLEKTTDVGRRIKGVLIGPGITFAMGLAFLVFAVIWFIPNLQETFLSFSDEPPPLTVAVMEFTGVLKWVAIAGTVLVFASWAWWVVFGRKVEKYQVFFNTIALTKIKGLSPILQLTVFSRHTRLLVANLDGGEREAKALRHAGDGCGSPAFKKISDDHILAMESTGARLADYADSPVFPKQAKILRSSGDLGSISETGRRLAERLDREAAYRLDSLSEKLGPVMNIIVMSLVGFVVVLVMAPMFGMFPAMLDSLQ